MHAEEHENYTSSSFSSFYNSSPKLYPITLFIVVVVVVVCLASLSRALNSTSIHMSILVLYLVLRFLTIVALLKAENTSYISPYFASWITSFSWSFPWTINQNLNIKKVRVGIIGPGSFQWKKQGRILVFSKRIALMKRLLAQTLSLVFVTLQWNCLYSQVLSSQPI
mgnify:CR=1 FL=1